MLEPIAYDIGRVCKDKSGVLTPNLIDIEIKTPTIKMPFDTPKEIVGIFESSFVEKTTYKDEEITYQIINVGKHVDLLKIEDVDLYIIADSRRLIERKELLIIPKIREKISPNSGIYFPSALPYEIPLLVYMGVDYFDDISAKYYASLGYKFTKNRLIKSNDDFETLYAHNKKIIDEVLEEVRYCIKEGCLRNLVEETVISHPHLRANYRRYNPDLRNIPLSKGKKIIVCIDETRIPEVKKYIERAKNYEPFTNVVVLLPCSSKKPYSTSKSHKFFINAINSSKMVVEEVILTSPYGLVPRALEGVVNYDIPVTGEWSNEEVEFINECLKNYIKKVKEKFGDAIIISHLPEHYLEILDLDDYINTAVDGNPLSDESLNSLKETLKKIKEEHNINLKKKEQKIHNYQQLAKFQFGVNFIPNDVVIKERPNKRFLINKDGKLVQICSLNENNGLFVLTLQGGELLWELSRKDSLYVEVNYDIRKGSLFAPGFKDCNENISVNDEVILIKDDEVVGVGRALMSGLEMKKAKHGALVNIRHVKP
ncbi:archaeosine synthase subunit alpha [Methanotorris igneus]|uniref:PUA domain containing protein n=1 Tax=Methanotorris igneus (strain DSM 5666 / JCM 11834 / Kol 5) TaxID=880724 RepID=F6BCV3_METIK|nr:archaeosine synthase subunit alpha [Methanotorris igneus]AEF96314.1 PUA domain containing protein [Methanotorris igneus Kol 5]